MSVSLRPLILPPPGHSEIACKVIGQSSFVNKANKVVRVALNVTAYVGQQRGDTAAVASAQRGLAVVKVIGFAATGLDAVGDLCDMAGNIRDAMSAKDPVAKRAKVVDAISNGTAVLSDGFSTALDVVRLAEVPVDPVTSARLDMASGAVAAGSLTFYVINTLVKAVKDLRAADKSRVEAASCSTDQKHIQAVHIHNEKVQRASGINNLLGVIEKTLIIALIVFAFIAAALALPFVVTLAVTSGLTLGGFIFGLTKMIRAQQGFAPPARLPVEAENAVLTNPVLHAGVVAGMDAIAARSTADVTTAAVRRAVNE